MPTSPAAAPSVRLDFTNPPMVVTFDFGTLERIESSLGKTINEILVDDFEPFISRKDEQDEGRLDRFKRQRFTFVVSFIAACLRCSREDLAQILPASQVLSTLGALANAFIRAVNQINGAGDEDEDVQATDPQMPDAIETSPTAGSIGPGSGG